jgi:transcriptional regulator with XRE-family HTH domain
VSSKDYIGDWLRYRRDRLEVSQLRLAKKIGVKRSVIADLERNKCRPSAEVLAQLNELFKDLNLEEI